MTCPAGGGVHPVPGHHIQYNSIILHKKLFFSSTSNLLKKVVKNSIFGSYDDPNNFIHMFTDGQHFACRATCCRFLLVVVVCRTFQEPKMNKKICPTSNSEREKHCRPKGDAHEVLKSTNQVQTMPL